MVLPFQGEIVTAKLLGKDLRNYLSHVLLHLNAGSGAFPQMSGVEAIVDRSKKKLISLKINGEEIKDSQEYTIALPEFIANGGDKYPRLNFSKFGYFDADILKEYIQSLGVLKLEDFKPTHYIQNLNNIELKKM